MILLKNLSASTNIVVLVTDRKESFYCSDILCVRLHYSNKSEIWGGETQIMRVVRQNHWISMNSYLVRFSPNIFRFYWCVGSVSIDKIRSKNEQAALSRTLNIRPLGINREKNWVEIISRGKILATFPRDQFFKLVTFPD